MTQRIAGLDSIRFLCALVVVFFHQMSPPLLAGLSRETPVGRVLLGLYDAAYNGQAAVIAFFVISGFCIHFPFAAGQPFFPGRFLLGRGIRILVPTLAFLLAIRWLGARDQSLTLPLWSVWCEVIYYALYPIFWSLRTQVSFRVLLATSYVGALVVIVGMHTGPDWNGLFKAGGLTWLAGLPCWLLGYGLAEHFVAGGGHREVTRTSLWLHRLGAVILSQVAFLAMLQFRLSFLVSLQFFAIYCYFWLRVELHWYRVHPANRTLEVLGRMTFSLYLIHSLARYLWIKGWPVEGWLAWVGLMGFVLSTSAIFYFLVERPAHGAARLFARGTRVKLPEPAPSPAVAEESA